MFSSMPKKKLPPRHRLLPEKQETVRFFPVELAKIHVLSVIIHYSVFRMDSTYVNIHMYMIVTMNELRISCEFNLYRYLIALNMYKNLYNKDSVQLLCRFIAEIRKKKRSVIHYPQNPGCNHRRSAGILSAIHSNHISTSTASPNKNSGILHFEKKIWVNFK